MKKSTKVILGTTASVFAVGAVLSIGALCMGGGRMFYENNYYSSVEQLEQQEVQDVSSLDFQLGVNSYRIRTGDSFRIEGDAESMKLLESYKEGNTWHIKTKKNQWFRFGKRYSGVTIYIPENATLYNADIQVGAGECDIETLKADSVSLQVGAGSLDARGLESQKKAEVEVGVGELNITSAKTGGASIECGMGSVNVSGRIEGNVDVNCGMGEVILDLENTYSDYNYVAQVGMGEVKIGDRSSGGIGGELKQHNGADYNMEIDCGMGEVQVGFRNQPKNEPQISPTYQPQKEGNYNETSV